ncbi:MAG TPA: MBL fold metallo-hydrolase [Abditibacteriaceae bacterium]
MDLSSLLFGHSKALYSTWLFYKPDHLLIDCGEGVATSLGNGSYAIERVLLTHGHIDHIAGLPPLIWSRAGGMGDNEKPLAIYYPRSDGYVADMQEYLNKTKSRLPFELTWVPLEAGASFSLPATDGSRHGRRVQTFATRHIRDRLTIGYKILETRRRLKPEYSTLAQEELRRLAQAGYELSENYEATLCAFGGDGLPLNPHDVQGAEVLLHEATILDAAERKHQMHSTLDEAMQVAAQVQPKAFVLYHVSGRYRRSDIEKTARESIARNGVDFPVWCLFRDRLWHIAPDENGARK